MLSYLTTVNIIVPPLILLETQRKQKKKKFVKSLFTRKKILLPKNVCNLTEKCSDCLKGKNQGGFFAFEIIVQLAKHTFEMALFSIISNILFYLYLLDNAPN